MLLPGTCTTLIKQQLIGRESHLLERPVIDPQCDSIAHVTLDVYDVTGRRVRALADELQDAGRYRLTWDGTTDAHSASASGVYWIRLRTSLGFDAKTKMVLLK